MTNVENQDINELDRAQQELDEVAELNRKFFDSLVNIFELQAVRSNVIVQEKIRNLVLATAKAMQRGVSIEEVDITYRAAFEKALEELQRLGIVSRQEDQTP